MKKTLLLLLAEYETATPKAEDVAFKVFGDDRSTFLRKAAKRDYPFPIYRAGGQKSPWLVQLSDLADYLDRAAKEEKANFEARRAS